jgi:hypothetical protein
MATKLEIENKKVAKRIDEDILEVKSKILELEQEGKDNRNKVLKINRENLEVLLEEKKLNEKQKQDLNQIEKAYEEVGDRAKSIGDNIENFIKSIPGGQTLSKILKVDELGNKMKEKVIDNIQQSITGGKELGATFKFAFGPIGIAAAALTAIVFAIRRVRRAARELAGELGTSAKFAKEQLISLKAQEASLKIQNFSSDNLKTTFKSIVDEFGSLENATAANAANLEILAQRTGTAASDVVKFNKVMMDLTGASFDVATNMAEAAIRTAEAANVSTNKVMSDIAQNAADFAKFSMDGAQGLAQAAVEAAKVGTSLSVVLSAADKLLGFETSISAQFEAQVLSGRQINLERARQLALDGEINALTQEIQSIIGGLGDIQSLNVIQRQSIADAIGITVADLQRIARGETIQETETVLDEQKKTNQILMEGLDVDKKILESTENKNVNIIQPAF